MSVEEKNKLTKIKRMKEVFADMKNFINTMEKDVESDDIKVQTSAIWLGGQFCEGYSNFVVQVKKLGRERQKIEEELKQITL